MGQLSDLVIGEAVVLELRIARLASRALAVLIDLALQVLTLGVGFAILTVTLGDLDQAATAALALLLSVTVLVIWPVTVETLSRGRSIGKLAMGLRVVRDDGGPVRFRQSLVRALIAVFPDIWFSSGSVALISSLASRHAKRLGDYAAGTLVVRERVPTSRGSAIQMPPALADWARGLDLTGLPDDLALAARQFLTRADEFDPVAARSLSERLGNAVSAHVGPPPPTVPAWAYLSAVLAERTRRETVRLMGTPAPTGAPVPAVAPVPSVAAAFTPPAPMYAPSPPTITPSPTARDDGFAPPS